MTWVRLESAYFSHPQTVAVGFWGSQAFLAAITMAKLHEWRGCIPKQHFTPDVIAHHLNLVTERNAVKQLRDGIGLCVTHGLLVEDATHYVIPSWRKFQPDPSSPERQDKFRKAAKVRRAAEGSNGAKRSAASVTPRLSSYEEERGEPLAPSGTGAAPPVAAAQSTYPRPLVHEPLPPPPKVTTTAEKIANLQRVYDTPGGGMRKLAIDMARVARLDVRFGE